MLWEMRLDTGLFLLVFIAWKERGSFMLNCTSASQSCFTVQEFPCYTESQKWPGKGSTNRESTSFQLLHTKHRLLPTSCCLTQWRGEGPYVTIITRPFSCPAMSGYKQFNLQEENMITSNVGYSTFTLDVAVLLVVWTKTNIRSCPQF